MVQTTNSSTDSFKDTLSIQVSLNGLSFCVLNSEQEVTPVGSIDFNTILSPELALSKIKELFREHPLLNAVFNTINVVYENELYTIVPLALFDENMLNTYLQSNVKVLSNDFIAYDVLTQHELVIVYIPYMNINNFLFDSFGSFNYTHTATLLIDKLLSKEKNNTGTVVYAHKNKMSFDLIIINAGHLLLANTFSAQTKEDFLYHLLFTTEQLSLNPEEFPLYCLGDIATTDEYYAIAHQYIRNISLMDIIAHEHSKFTDTASNTEARKHFALLSTI